MTMPFLCLAALSAILAPPVVDGWPRASRARLGAAATGLGAGIVFAALRATAVLESRSAVSLPAATALTIADLLLLAALALVVARPAQAYEGRGAPVINGVACLVLALTFFRATPETILQLSAFIEPGETVFSSEMLLRVLGFLGGWAAVAVTALIYSRAYRMLPRRYAAVSVMGFAVVMLLTGAADLARLLHSTRRLQLSGELFRTMSWATNNMQGAVLLGAVAVLTLPLVGLFAVSLRPVPAQPGPARLRAERAARRRSRRWVMAASLGFGALFLTRTVAVAKVNEVPTLSEPEPYTLDEDAGLAKVALTSLADGHLHRYAYAASGGVEVRFIAILKNGGAYGVGLDACENCGPSGYYEDDGKVICKRCDVAINPATIGFKGGCNPIPVDFTVEGGTLSISTSILEESAKVFA